MKKLIESLRMFFGYRYIANKKTKEVHYIPNVKKSCGVHLMTNGKRLTRRGFYRHISKGYDGCVHCLRGYNKG